MIAHSVPRGVTFESLAKHLSIFGLPGAGKSTCVANIGQQLFQRRIPLIILEPAKTDYRVYKCLEDHPDPAVREFARNLQVYTPGNEHISPLRFNPLLIPDGISRNEHIENLMIAFEASMPMAGPIRELLAPALEDVYEEFPGQGTPPLLVNVYEAARRVLAGKGYSSDVESDIRAAIDVRLGGLTRRDIGKVFQCARSVPSLDDLMSGCTLIELASMTPKPACLLVLFFLTIVREHVQMTPWGGKGVRLAIVIEEAHNLIGPKADAAVSEENADPKAFASEFLCRMLAELRSLGVGIVIVDQLPSRVAPEVIKNTGTKVAFRLAALDDREALGTAMRCRHTDIEEMARLLPGKAYVSKEGYYRPQLIRTPNLQAELGLPSPPLGRAIVPYLRNDEWFIRAARARMRCELGRLRTEMDRFDTSRLDLAARAARLAAGRVQVLSQENAEARTRGLARLASQAARLRIRLDAALKALRREVYCPLLGEHPQKGIMSRELSKFREHLIHRFEKVITPDVESCLVLLDRFIRKSRGGIPSNRKGA